MADPIHPAVGLASVRELGVSVLDMLHTRAELLVVEFQQERDRLVERLLYGALALLLAFLTLVLGAVLVVAAFWDTPHRLLAVAVTMAVPGLAAVLCAASLAAKVRARIRPFDASLLALQADLAALR